MPLVYLFRGTMSRENVQVIVNKFLSNLPPRPAFGGGAESERFLQQEER
jgi:hypothetical protein